MQIRNTTKWRTEDLREFFRAALKHEGLREGEAGGYIKVGARRDAYISGFATLDSNWVCMTMRNPFENETCMAPSMLHDLGQIFVHEIGHNAGLRHKEMVRCNDIPVPWTVGLQIRREAAKPKVKRNLQAERRAKAETKLAEWQKKQTRAAKLVKKWKAKVRYYERAAEKKAALNGKAKT